MVSIDELRKPKIYNMAIFDLVGTFIIAGIFHLFLWIYPLDMSVEEKNKRTYLQYLLSLLLIFVMFLGIAVIFHRIFGINSALSSYLGFNNIPIRV